MIKGLVLNGFECIKWTATAAVTYGSFKWNPMNYLKHPNRDAVATADAGVITTLIIRYYWHSCQKLKAL